MNEEEFDGLCSGEYSEINLKSYPGEKAIGVKFLLVIAPEDYEDFSIELQNLINKYAL